MMTRPGQEIIYSFAVFLGSLAVAFVCYHSTLFYPFLAWDDYVYIVDDPIIQQLDWQNLFTAWTTERNGVWYPLARMSHAIDIHYFGLNPLYHHAVNIFIHGINGFLLFLLSRQLIGHFTHEVDTTRKIGLSAAVAVIFLLHPQHVEVVAWITQRNELLATLFFLLCLLFYLKALAAHSKHWNYALSFLCSAIALTAKPTATGLFVIVFSLELALLGNRGNAPKALLRQAFWRVLPFGLLAISIGWISVTTHNTIHAFPLHDLYGFTQRLCYAAHNVFDFLFRFLVPIHLTPFVEFPVYLRTPSWEMFIPLASLSMTTALLCLLAWRKSSYPLLLFVSYVALILPCSGLILFGTYSASDRYMYMPSAMLLSVIPTLLCSTTKFNNNTLQQGLVFALLPLIVASVISMHAQLASWKNDLALWNYTIRYQPQAGYPRVYLAENLARSNQLTAQQAAAAFEQAIAIEPVHAGFLGLISVYHELGDDKNLRWTHERLIQRYPHYSAASKVSLGIIHLLAKDTYPYEALILQGLQEDSHTCQGLRDQITATLAVDVTAAAQLKQILDKSPACRATP